MTYDIILSQATFELLSRFHYICLHYLPYLGENFITKVKISEKNVSALIQR